MGRKPTISRDRLLTIAEDIVNAEGPQALTIDALAKAAGISKGGVQYSFLSKDELVKALVDRWTAQFDALVVDIESAGPLGFVRSYIAAMRSSQGAIDAKLAGLMIAYMQNPQNRMNTADWYRSILSRMDGSAEARAARTAFLAVEGLVTLRIWGVEDGVDWQSQLDDIEAVLLAEIA
ncbi:AcrR family transcriptional regulator [Rhodopseudomonas julia]|uniref:AcrR family transcriptional regulator n=1 Tax=Rhodopseudomonas julia TaxID=200617 RepID=A0ABU0CA54_9BRAD|nr:TetR/AcrR family transcriptional regulator [Rhodopseudomonas julia]MDQ0325957.1 AcrR family transcriptional regulator [Rhodopseudomonas julia]